jgi:hypothetical protein
MSTLMLKHLLLRYIGKLLNGKVFDSNTSGQPFYFRLGAGEVIKGWDQGIEGMAVGGERKLTVSCFCSKTFEIVANLINLLFFYSDSSQVGIWIAETTRPASQ